VETTDAPKFDGSIEGAIAALIEPEQPEVTEEAAQDATPEPEAEVEEVEEEQEPEEASDEADEPEGELSEDDSEDEALDEAEEYEETEEDADPQQEQTKFTVKVDGKNEVVTLDELKQSYSGQKYIQQGMQQNAETKKQAEAVYNALLQERQAIADLYQQAVNGQMPTEPQEPPRELFDTDPIGYMDAKLKYDDQLVEYNAEMQKLQAVTEQQSKAQEVAQQAYLRQEMENLKMVVPELASGDAKKASAYKHKMLEAGINTYGYTTEEMGAIMDHRALRVLNDAIKYQEIIKGKEAAEQKARPESRKKRTVKPGAKRQNSKAQARKKQKQTLARTGRVQDALSLLID